MRIFADAEGILAAQHALNMLPKDVQKSAARALNRALTAGRTQLSKGVRENYVAKAGDIKATLRTKKATFSRLEASLHSTGRPIDLISFRVRQSRRGIYAQVKKGGGGRRPHSFFVTVRRAGIYHRETGKRLPIQKEFGPSIPQMAGNDRVKDAVEARMQEVFEARFAHEIERSMGGSK